MSAAVFDTLQASRKLRNAGISEQNAEAIVCSMADAFSDTVATKADIAELKADMLKVAIAGLLWQSSRPTLPLPSLLCACCRLPSDGRMSNDAKWTVGTAIALAVLLVPLIVSQHAGTTARLDAMDKHLESMSERLNSMAARLLSIEEHLRAAPAPALPDASH